MKVDDEDSDLVLKAALCLAVTCVIYSKKALISLFPFCVALVLLPPGSVLRSELITQFSLEPRTNLQIPVLIFITNFILFFFYF